MKHRYPSIDDVAEATSWWARFGRLASNRRAEELALAAAGELDELAHILIAAHKTKGAAESPSQVTGWSGRHPLVV
jgi:hypothetical protein